MGTYSFVPQQVGLSVIEFFNIKVTYLFILDIKKKTVKHQGDCHLVRNTLNIVIYVIPDLFLCLRIFFHLFLLVGG